MTLIEKLYEKRGKRLSVGGHRGHLSEIFRAFFHLFDHVIVKEHICKCKNDQTENYRKNHKTLPHFYILCLFM